MKRGRPVGGASGPESPDDCLKGWGSLTKEDRREMRADFKCKGNIDDETKDHVRPHDMLPTTCHADRLVELFRWVVLSGDETLHASAGCKNGGLQLRPGLIELGFESSNLPLEGLLLPTVW